MSEALSDVTEQELQGLYTWVDEIPLSRPKRNIARDFSDGVLTAEVVHHYFPKLVELHNYSLIPRQSFGYNAQPHHHGRDGP
ncbi:SPEF1-like protein [Haematococcus lacustris]|uniref:SPEF1-like protein n=1 Tax=Haematococcus lacustris TaxID=44745 RepID=A0A699Z3R8_HAELA|nr:SPEF1-like protein [Haematococcus lacustris]